MLNAVWIYWETLAGRQEPPYITLCRWTMLHNWKDCNLIFVNSKNVDSYLPGISSRIGNIQVDLKGRLDYFARKVKPNPINLAVKSDVIRANLLNEYGGLYIDASAIALKPITHYFDLLAQNDHKNFFCTKRQSHNKNHYPVSFYGCNKHSKIIGEYTQEQSALLKTKRFFHYNELGAETLTPIVNKYLNEAVVSEEKRFMPVPPEEADVVYSSTHIQLKSLLLQESEIFKLFNGPFKGPLSKLSVYDLYHAPNLVGQVFRHAMPQDIFAYYYSRHTD